MEEKEIKKYEVVSDQLIGLNNHKWLKGSIIYATNIESLPYFRSLGLTENPNVLKPIYKEVKPKFKVGDWVVVLHGDKYYYNSEKQAQKIKSIYPNSFCPYILLFSDDETKGYSKIRVATREEIEKAWSEQLLKKWGVSIGDSILITYQYNHSTFKNVFRLKGFKLLHRDDDIKYFSGTNVQWFKNHPEEDWQLGVLSEYHSYSPDITVTKVIDISKIVFRGYNCKIVGNTAVFGCKTFTKEFIYQLASLIEEEDLEIEHSEDIMKLTEYFRLLESK